MIGETLGGKYTIVRQLGEGGMGAVYEARHTGTGRRVAIKVITGELAHDPRLVSRFEQEARAAGVLESDHVVQVLDVGVDAARNAPFLAMEYLVGEDVQHLVERLGPLPADLAMRIGVQACLGLEKAHAQGIVHRDIKPANLFLAARESGELVVKVLDFGIAKMMSTELGPAEKKRPVTGTGTLLGSPLYMSPEQARSPGKLDHRSDIWSLGVVLYQALAGRTPFDDVESVGDFIVMLCGTSVPPIRTIAPWVDPAVAAAVERALTLDPQGRYATAAAMREALAAFLPEGDGAAIRIPMLVPAEGTGRPPLSATQLAVPFSLTPGTGAAPPPGPAGGTLPGAPPPTAALAPLTVPATSPAGPHAKPLPAFYTAAVAPVAPPPPAPRAASKGGGGLLVAAALVALVGGALGGAYALGWLGGDTHSSSSRSTPEPATGTPAPSKPGEDSLASLAGMWWTSAGQAYEGVRVGETVELRVHDATQFQAEGYTPGEAAFVLHPIEGKGRTFRVDARVRPAAPKGSMYDHARAAASCVAVWSEVAGKALLAQLAIDRLVVQTAHVEPPASVFVHEGYRVVGCSGLAEAHPTEGEIILGREPVAPPHVPVVVVHHDAGPPDAGAVHDAGLPPPHDAGTGAGEPLGGPCQTDAQCAQHNCYSGKCIPAAKGPGSACLVDAQCTSHKCTARVCK